MKYGEAVAAWARNGGKPVVVKRDTDQWKAWDLYYHQFNLDWVLKLMSGKHSWTVPCEFPGQFDTRFDRSIGDRNKAAKDTKPDLPVSERKEFVAKVRGFTVGDPDGDKDIA